MSSALMFPNTPQTRTMSAGTSPAYQRPRGIALDDPDPVRHPGRGRPIPGEGDQRRIELDQQRGDLRTPWMGRHDVDHVPPLPRAQADYPDGPWMGTGSAISSSVARTMDCTCRSRATGSTPDPRRARASAPSGNRPHPTPPTRAASPPHPPAPAAPISGWSPDPMTAHRRVVRGDRPMIKYIGSKRRLVPVLTQICQASGARTALDLFTGTTRVAQAFKAQGVHVTAVDSARYAHTFARTYIEADAAATDSARCGRRSPTSTLSPAGPAMSPRRSAVRPASSNRTTPPG